MIDKDKLREKREKEREESINLWNSVIEDNKNKKENSNSKKDKKDKK